MWTGVTVVPMRAWLRSLAVRRSTAISQRSSHRSLLPAITSVSAALSVVLRSSAAPKGDHHADIRGCLVENLTIAILGRLVR